MAGGSPCLLRVRASESRTSLSKEGFIPYLWSASGGEVRRDFVIDVFILMLFLVISPACFFLYLYRMVTGGKYY